MLHPNLYRPEPLTHKTPSGLSRRRFYPDILSASRFSSPLSSSHTSRGPMNHVPSRRDFLATSAGLAAAAALPAIASGQSGKEPPFKISLAEWSLHKAINGG